MAEAGRNPTQGKASSKSKIIIRVAVVAVLAVLVVLVIRWTTLKSTYDEAHKLYDVGRYEAASERLTEVVNSSLSVFRLRSEARHTLGLCKLAMAEQVVYKLSAAKNIGDNRPNSEERDRGLKLLDEAEALGIKSKSIQDTRKTLAEEFETTSATPPKAK